MRWKPLPGVCVCAYEWQWLCCKTAGACTECIFSSHISISPEGLLGSHHSESIFPAVLCHCTCIHILLCQQHCMTQLTSCFIFLVLHTEGIDWRPNLTLYTQYKMGAQTKLIWDYMDLLGPILVGGVHIVIVLGPSLVVGVHILVDAINSPG